MNSSALHRALRPQKTTPDTELHNPAGLVDELVFFARVLLCIPHHAIFCFPAHVDAGRKLQYGKGGCITSGCGHKYHLLVLQFSKVTLLWPAFLVLYCIPPAIQGSLGGARQRNRGPRNPLCGKAVSRYQKNCGSAASAQPGTALAAD